jgi:cardiolipin synthase (CMP-forming)
MINIPNVITLGRLIAVPILIWLISDGNNQSAFWVFVVAGLSDAVDGFIAKRFNAETLLGKFMDPLADKALLVSVYIALGNEGHLASWLVIMVVFRDLMIIGGALLFQTLTQSLTMEPLLISKINTTAQIFLAALVLCDLGYNLGLYQLADVLSYGVALTTAWSGVAYIVIWGRRTAASGVRNGR